MENVVDQTKDGIETFQKLRQQFLIPTLGEVTLAFSECKTAEEKKSYLAGMRAALSTATVMNELRLAFLVLGLADGITQAHIDEATNASSTLLATSVLLGEAVVKGENFQRSTKDSKVQ